MSSPNLAAPRTTEGNLDAYSSILKEFLEIVAWINEDENNTTEGENFSSSTLLGKLQQRFNAAKAIISGLEQQLGEMQEQLGETQEQLSETQEQLGETQTENDDLKWRLEEMELFAGSQQQKLFDTDEELENQKLKRLNAETKLKNMTEDVVKAQTEIGELFKRLREDKLDTKPELAPLTSKLLNLAGLIYMSKTRGEQEPSNTPSPSASSDNPTISPVPRKSILKKRRVVETGHQHNQEEHGDAKRSRVHFHSKFHNSTNVQIIYLQEFEGNPPAESSTQSARNQGK